MPFAEPVSPRLLRILATIAFTWAALVSLVWILSRSVCTRTREQAFVSVMVSELWSIEKAQQEFHTAYGRYAASTAELGAAVSVRHSYLVFVSIDHATTETWSASATSPRARRWTCTFDQRGGRPACRKQTTWAERNIPKPSGGWLVLEFWLVWLSLVRRQRRATIAMT